MIYRRWCRNPEIYTCVKIVGDSIHLLLQSGSIVAINQTQKNPKALDGKTAAFRRDGGVTIKWLKLMIEDLVMAIPENKQSKKIYSFRGEEIDRAIIGKIDWSRGRQK